MKQKNSWDLKPKESIYNKKERIQRHDNYRKQFPDEDPNTFRCMCGLRHKWSELGLAHTVINKSIEKTSKPDKLQSPTTMKPVIGQSSHIRTDKQDGV